MTDDHTTEGHDSSPLDLAVCTAVEVIADQEQASPLFYPAHSNPGLFSDLYRACA